MRVTGSFLLRLSVCLGFLAVASMSAAAPNKTKPADNKAKPAEASKPGQVIVFWPKPSQDSALARAFHSAVDVFIDGQKAGSVDFGKPVTAGLSPGPHKIKVGDGGLLGLELRDRQTQINVSPGKNSYYYIYNWISGMAAAELDAMNAQAEISGVPAKANNGMATIRLYWEANLLELGFLKSDVEFFLDGKRIGAMTSGDYIVAKVPAGRHTLTMGSSPYSDLREELLLGAGMTNYYYLRRKQYWEFYQLPFEYIAARERDFRLRQTDTSR